MYKNSVRTSQETHYAYAAKVNRLIPFREIIAGYCENRAKNVNALCRQNAEIFIVLKHLVLIMATGIKRVKMLETLDSVQHNIGIALVL
jgi:hypothetical protein